MEDIVDVIVDETMHVAGKATGVRAYVDYDSTSGLPAITTLSGELIVTSGGAQTTLQPIANITPQRATEINRGSVGHTLNFLIPGPWCDGDIDIRLRVFDASIPGQKSGALHRTLRFVRVNPLRVYAVGINYTGAGLNLAPPVEADFATTFDYTRRIWPTGDLLFSGYTTLEFSESLAGTKELQRRGRVVEPLLILRVRKEDLAASRRRRTWPRG